MDCETKVLLQDSRGVAQLNEIRLYTKTIRYFITVIFHTMRMETTYAAVRITLEYTCGITTVCMSRVSCVFVCLYKLQCITVLYIPQIITIIVQTLHEMRTTFVILLMLVFVSHICQDTCTSNMCRILPFNRLAFLAGLFVIKH